MFAEIMAVFEAIKLASQALIEISKDIKQMKQDSIDSSLANYKKDVDETINKIMAAKTNEERAALARQLNINLGK